MQSTVTIIRAIGVEFAKRALRPFIIIGTILTIALLTLGGWLTTQSAWWWILEVLCIIGTIIFIALVMAVHIVLRTVAPPLTTSQKKSVAAFVDKLERVAEHLHTPQPVIIFYVVRDIIWPKRGSFVESISKDSRTLAPDFSKLRQEFK